MTPQDDTRFDRNLINSLLEENRIDATYASIREMNMVVSKVEQELGVRYLRMEFGVPGLEPKPIGPEAEIAALRKPRTASMYAPFVGLPGLKEEGSKFLKNFLNVEVSPEFVIPTVGSMHGGFLAQSVAGRRDPRKPKILFIDPGFSVHRTQCRFLGLKAVSVDLYDRERWLDEVEKLCAVGDIGGLLFSSPNNPTWVILTEDEVRRLGEICTKYDVLAIEDAAYFGMDFRRDYSVPGEPPYPSTVARYTDNYIYLLSGSKIFSYAGQRVALAFLSPNLANRDFPGLQEHFGKTRLFDAFVLVGLYCTTSCVAQSVQHGLTAFLRKANQGELNFLKGVKVYAERAEALRNMMLANDFALVYAEDLGEPLSNGFFFTFSYPGFNGGELVRELLYYGISATTLAITGSKRLEGVRACTSLVGKEDFDLFRRRIEAFRKDHPVDATP